MLQLWDCIHAGSVVPKGRLKHGSTDQPSLRDYWSRCRAVPNAKALGYCHISLRETPPSAQSMQLQRVAVWGVL